MNSKQKFIYLIISIILALILVYVVAISETIKLWRVYNMNAQRLEAVVDAPQQIKIIEDKLQELSSVIGANAVGDKIHERLHGYVSEYCKKRRITFYDYPPVHHFTSSGFLVETNMLVVEGRFSSLLTLLHELEFEANLGKVISAGFYSEKYIRTKQNKLFLRVYIQHIKKENNEI